MIFTNIARSLSHWCHWHKPPVLPLMMMVTAEIHSHQMKYLCAQLHIWFQNINYALYSKCRLFAWRMICITSTTQIYLCKIHIIVDDEMNTEWWFVYYRSTAYAELMRTWHSPNQNKADRFFCCCCYLNIRTTDGEKNVGERTIKWEWESIYLEGVKALSKLFTGIIMSRHKMRF